MVSTIPSMHTLPTYMHMCAMVAPALANRPTAKPAAALIRPPSCQRSPLTPQRMAAKKQKNRKTQPPHAISDLLTQSCPRLWARMGTNVLALGAYLSFAFDHLSAPCVTVFAILHCLLPPRSSTMYTLDTVAAC